MAAWNEKLNKGLQKTDILRDTINQNIQEIIYFSIYIPYLAHAIQLVVTILLYKIKISAKNNEVESR